MRPRISIFAKQLLLYLLLIALMAGVIGALLSSTARGHLEEEVGRKMEYVARIAAETVPLERLELIRDGDDGTRMVLRLKQRLDQIREATGAENLFVFRPTGTSLLDLDDEVRIGSPYELPQLTPALLAQLKQGESVHAAGYQQSQGETRLSAFAPVVDDSGELYAIVGVHPGTRELGVISRMRQQLLWITGIVAFIGLGLALVLARSITSPIREIAATAERLGRGEYGARARVRTSDEVGRLAESVNAMAEAVRSRDAALKEMAASVAHEIRNPLNSIKLLLSLLDEQLGAQRGADAGQTMRTLHYEIGKLNRLIEEFLTYARPLTLMGDEVQAARLVARVQEMAAAEAEDRGVSVTVEVAGDLPTLHVDGQRLEQGLLNIVMNGIQAAGEGGWVRIRAERVGDGVDLIVEDSGPGLSDEVAAAMFDPFYTTRADGTGLGLANARKIAEQHGGCILADNLPEGGARVILRLTRERLVERQG